MTVGRFMRIVVAPLLLVLAGTAAPAWAQGALINGENQTGTIALAGEVDTWTFTANAGEHLAITVAEVGADSPFVPYVRVINPAGAQMAHDWGPLVGALTVTAPTTGAYTVQVMSNDVARSATGTYVLRLAKVPGTFVVPVGDEGGALTNGANHQGVIERGDLDIWSFTANAGDHIALTVAEVGADLPFMPYLRLISPTGTQLAQDWGTLTGAFSLTAATTGTYTVIVFSNDTARSATGAYVLRLAKVPGTFVVPTGDEGGTLTNGANHTGVIDLGDMDLWSFTANAGDHIALTVAEVGADLPFMPYLRLISPAGTQLAQDWGALVGGFSVSAPATGTYTVIVFSNDTARSGTGNYVLRLAKVPGSFVVPTGDEGGALTNGADHAGVIERGDLDIWSFTANAGDHIALTVAEVGADLPFMPYLRLISPTGTQLAQDWGAVTGAFSVTAATTGTYTVIVFSNDVARSATGTYVLRLAKVPSAFVVPTGDEGGTLTNGGNHTGVISRGDMDLWSFAANAGEHIALTVAEVGADLPFMPYLRLISPTGSQLAQDWGALAGRISVSAPVTGTYTVIVFSNDVSRSAEGSYVIRRATAPSPFTVPAGDEGGALRNGTAHPGVIERGDIDQWSFAATAGRLVTLTLSETGADTAFMPYLRIISPTGSQISQNWGATAARIDFTPSATGEYRVIVLSNDVNGAAAGSYVITATGISDGGTAANPRRDVAVDFGNAGLWMRYNSGDPVNQRWALLDARNPGRLVVGDLDGNGVDDLVATFPGAGTRAWMNDREWVQLHHFEAADMTVGDVDADGLDDVVMSFTGYGTYVWMNNASWSFLHPLAATQMAAGQLDGDADGRDDLVLNFTGYGVWRYMNNTTWQQLHPLNSTLVRAADLDGNGRADLIMNFAGYGVWTFLNNNDWTQLHGLNAAAITVGNIDGDANSRQDVVLDFTGHGVWSWMNNTTWVVRHPIDAVVMAAGDLDASGRDDLLLGFQGYGIWIWLNNASWTQLHPLVPDNMVMGRFDAN